MSNYQRTHHCNILSKVHIGQRVCLAGWVHRRRDHGGVIFIDLRDRFGITQVVFHPEKHAATHSQASSLRSEWVIAIEGEVVARAEGMENPKLKTGEIEISVTSLHIFSQAKTPPFSICDEKDNVQEELRLKYRYLDLRRKKFADTLQTRHNLMLETRKYFDSQHFLEISTPLLGKSTPEGARDYLVPSRIFPGTFYALPQSPQLFKQLLMIAGMDRYFQIAPCFRDEDLRADRQPEFTQIDIEMSFGSPQELFTIIENLCQHLFKKCFNIEIKTPFPRISHKDAMENYGTDKPDLRFAMPLIRLDDIIQQSHFSIFVNELKAGGVVKGLCVKGGSALSRKKIDEYTAFVGKWGIPGLAWIKMQKEGPSSHVVKFFDPPLLSHLVKRMQATEGDLMFFVASSEKVTNQALDHLRRKIAQEQALIDPQAFCFTWVTEFPLFQQDLDSGNYSCEHHPFTAPHEEDLPLLDIDPLKVRSSSYDLVLNGSELGSGSSRIYQEDLQKKIFKILQFSEEEIKKRFGFFTEALKYGTPPHLGIALGFDRIVMLTTGAKSLRDVIAFPKTQSASDLMQQAPSAVIKEQLTELKIHVESSEF